MPSKIPTPPLSPSLPRSLLPLPQTALIHNTTFLEEPLFSQAFPALTSALTSGLSTNHPAYIPTPDVLALAATICVHPNYTTRTNDRDRWRDADCAGRYLRAVVDVVDCPGEGGLREAFTFKEQGRKSAATGRGKRGRDSGVGVGEDGERVLAGRYAGQQSLWCNAADLWAVVGWAFNCSVRYQGRWERWRVLLEILLRVLDRDLAKSVEKGEGEGEGEVKVKVKVKDTLLMQYLQSIGGGRNDRRRIMRAVFADGSEKSLGEFGEVWRDETRSPKVENDDEICSKKRKLDLENGEYGDYFDDDSAAEDDNTTSSSSSTRPSRSAASKPRRCPSAGTSDVSSSSTSSTSSAPHSLQSFGGFDSLLLRQRFLALLAQFSHTSPKHFGLDLSDLWSLYTEFLRPLPLPIFQQFISPQKAYLSPAWQASLCEMMSRALVGIKGTFGVVTLVSLEKDIVGATANNTSVSDNAKVGVLVESLLRLLWVQGFLNDADGRLKGLVEEGIERREAKASWRKKGGIADEDAREMLRLSGERLRVLVHIICK